MIRIGRKKVNIALALLAMICTLLGLFYATAESTTVFAETTVTVYNNGSRLSTDKGTQYQWLKASAQDGEYAEITGATTQHYDITKEDEGAYIKVRVGGVESSNVIGPIGKLYVFDLAKARVEVVNGAISGKDADGNSITGTHAANNIYVIKQSNRDQITDNGIKITKSSIPFDITLDGINILNKTPFDVKRPGIGGNLTNFDSCINIPASETTKVTLRVKGENSVRGIHYYTQTNTSSYLKITDINGDNETSGTLYIPKKVNVNDQTALAAFMAEKTNYNHWNAGIGGDDGNSDVRNLTLAGGNIQVLTTYGDNCSAIGAGGNGYAQVFVTGGNVYAACNGTGTAIGGGIGWNSAGGSANVTISGGKIYAKNYAELSEVKNGKTHTVGGVAIGGASSFHSSGAKGVVTITGGTVEAYGTFGNGMGGGNSSTSTGGPAEIEISGGTVKASSIGGGNSESGNAGDATVKINDSANVTLVKGIGGGDSASGKGGAANITVNNGVLHCGATIGGGQGGGNGAGGDATIVVKGGELKSKAVGGGLGAGSGNGGSASVDVRGGKMVATTIGGGRGGETGKLGNATANISGGEITGQFIMAEGATPCTFTMSGGMLYGINTSSEEYQYKNGGAVYIEDPKGEVRISGGTITKGVAENGGAIYLGGGNVYISGGYIEGNTANENGGGVYVGNGNFYMEGGSLSNNTATNGIGGGAYVKGTDDIHVSVRSGYVQNNKAKLKGGAIAVIGNEGNLTEELFITIGIKAQHYDSNGNRIDCDHKEHGVVSQWSCPIVSGNQVTEAKSEGGAFYITGSYTTYFNVYCLLEENNTADGGQSKSDFMKVDGGKVIISSLQSDDDEDCEDSTYGNVLINGTFHVAGGQVDLKGTMSSPQLLGAITVDVETADGDYFNDQRKNNGELYTVQYFEDFFGSGRYTQISVPVGTNHTIMGIMYGNLGYAFDGWFEKDENGYYTTAYTVGQGLIINENLKLYAKWNANVYFVIFNANVPPETTYSGTMENAQYAYNTQYYLPINTYQRKGYFFEGWALSATAEEVKYADGARIVNLANSAGEEVILYAVWRKCLHGTLEYSVSGNVMTRYCNCLAFSETATVKANNCVYDGASHAATVVYSGAAWANSSLEHVYKKYGETEYVATGTVINAGYYTATFKHNEISLSISFEIEKANQKAPAKPTYTTTDDAVNHTITISPASDEVLGTEQRYEYRIGYLSNDKTLYQYNTNPQDNVFYLSISLTNYFAYIRFAETDNYKASEYTRADAVYFFSGNVSIKVIESEGLSGEAKEAQQGDDFIGITVLCSLKEGYYNFNFGIDTTQSQLCGATYNIEGLNIHIYDIPENSALVIYLVGAKREVKVDSYIEAGEVFGKPEKTSEIKIANDSSYTVYFGIQNYALYDGLSLSFNQALPENTSIILIDKTQEQYTYWYYLFGEESSSVSLLDFIAMQSDTTISTSGESLQYQFIVDFSNCEADLLENALTVRLTATPQSGVPAFPNSNCSIKLYKVTSKVEKIAGTVANETNNLTVAYAQMDEENISASKWENRQATLVLEPENVATLPLDLAVEIVERTQTTLYYRTGNYFIMPLNMAENSLENVSLTLKSKLFPEEGATYNFTGALYVSNSNAGKAPMNTVPIQSGISMSFTVPKTEMPSLKITGRIRHCTVDGSLTVFVAGEIPDGFDLTADVMKKEENKEGNSKVYSSTGIWPNVTVNANLTVDFANLNMEEGSYCLLLTVKEHNTGLIKLQVPYYFIIYGHSQKTQ